MLALVTVGCAQPTLDADKASAVLRSHARFAEPIVIGLPLDRSADDESGETAAAWRVLVDRGDLVLAVEPVPTAGLTEAGQARIGTNGWNLLDGAAGRTLAVPVARRELLEITTLSPDDTGGRIGFEWRWVVTAVGQALRAGGVDLRHWGLRIDDEHTFRGGASLTLAGETWIVDIVRPPDRAGADATIP